MYACICHAVTVDEVGDAVAAGAETIEQVGAAVRAGTSCHNCHDHLEDILDDVLAQRCAVCPLAGHAVA